jgi:hypothetical protein
MAITSEEFEKYEAIILSGQMAQEDVSHFLEENLEFAEWYRERATRRQHD